MEDMAGHKRGMTRLKLDNDKFTDDKIEIAQSTRAYYAKLFDVEADPDDEKAPKECHKL